MHRSTSNSLLLRAGIVTLALLLLWWLAMSSPATAPQAAASPGSGAPAPSESIVAPALVASKVPQPTRSIRERAPQRMAAERVPQRQGPVAELSQRFASESRAQSSQEDETQVRAAYIDPTIPSTLLRNVECRRSVCRAELRWSAEHEAAYVLGLTRAVGKYVVPVGIEGAGPAEADGHRPVVVYIGLARPVPSAF